jgi:hypothetical protein
MSHGTPNLAIQCETSTRAQAVADVSLPMGMASGHLVNNGKQHGVTLRGCGQNAVVVLEKPEVKI